MMKRSRSFPPRGVIKSGQFSAEVDLIKYIHIQSCTRSARLHQEELLFGNNMILSAALEKKSTLNCG